MFLRTSFNQIFSCFLLSGFLASCGSGVQDTPVRTTPVFPKNSASSPTNPSLSKEVSGNEDALQTKILVPLHPEDYVIQVLDVNLDIDQLEEQIIVLKKKNDPQDQIQILVVDFETVRNTYVPVWIGATLATNSKTFTLYTEDILGDHVPEILCFGRNNKGEQTLDIFKKTLPPQGLGLYYSPIFSLASAGSIEVQEEPRSEAYRLLQKNDPSFPIHVYTPDPGSNNIMDLIKSTYYWNQNTQQYTLGGQEKVPGQIQAEKQLAELFARDAEGFEQFLAGPWYRVTSEKKESSSTLQRDMVLFDPASRQIVFYNGEMQEVLVWQSSYRTIYRGLYINSFNEAIPSIQKQISISVVGMDTIELQVRSIDDTWGSTYKKLSKELQNLQITSRSPAITLSPFHLKGLYKNEGGTEIFFDSPSFTLREKERELTGGYAIYTISGNTIMQLKVLKSNGLVESVRTYKADFTEEKKGNQIVRTLVLYPAQIGISKVEVQSTESLRFHQVEESGE